MYTYRWFILSFIYIYIYWTLWVRMNDGGERHSDGVCCTRRVGNDREVRQSMGDIQNVREWARGIDGWIRKASSDRLCRRVGILGRKWNKSEKRSGSGWRKRKELRLSIPIALHPPTQYVNFYPRGACFIYRIPICPTRTDLSRQRVTNQL